MAPVLGYWKIRGLAQRIRLLLTYVGDEYEEKLYEFGPAPDYDRSAWLDEKFKLGLDFPNLPYYIDGDVKLSQTRAIVHYIARKHDLGGKTEEERIKIDIFENHLDDLQRSFILLCYNPNFESLKDGYLKTLAESLKQLSEFLGKRKFFIKDEVTFIDFVAYDFFSQQLVLKSDCLNLYPNLQEFQARIESLPNIGDFVKNSPTYKYALNGKMATYGNE